MLNTQNEVKISAFEVADSPNCVASSDGDKIFKRIATAIRSGKRVVLSFEGVDVVAPPFLNAAVGQLYGEFSENQIRRLLEVRGVSSDDKALLELAVKDAKEYFKDPEMYEQKLHAALAEE